MLAGSVAATQYLARTFADAPELGEPLLSVGGAPLYPPFDWYRWQRQWGRHAQKDFGVALALAFGGVVVGLGAAMRVRGGDRTPQPTGAHGTARWAEVADLERVGMLGTEGIVLCQTAEAELRRTPNGGWEQKKLGRLLRHDGPEHAIVFAPTRSGKGVGVVVPTLLAWTGSVIVYDPKRENWDLTAGWRRKFSHCLRFDPSAKHSVRFNPLMEVRPAPLDVRDAQNIAEILVNPDTTEEQREAWNTGHEGGLATIHANDTTGMLDRVCQLIEEKVYPAPRRVVAEAIHLCVHLTLDLRAPAGRRLSGLDRVRGYDAAQERWLLEPLC